VVGNTAGKVGVLEFEKVARWWAGQSGKNGFYPGVLPEIKQAFPDGKAGKTVKVGGVCPGLWRA
jgi:hypothetical protein